MKSYAIAIIVTASLLVWGCGKPAPSTASLDRLKDVEARVLKLEKDLKATEAALASALKHSRNVEEQLASTVTQLTQEKSRTARLEKERDELVMGLKTRTTERDVVQAQYDGFRKNLKELLVQMESSTLPTPTPSSTSLGTTGTSVVVPARPSY